MTDTQDTDFHFVRDYLTGLQDRICAAIEGADGAATFREDQWQRAEGGGEEQQGEHKGADAPAIHKFTVCRRSTFASSVYPRRPLAQPQLSAAALRSLAR